SASSKSPRSRAAFRDSASPTISSGASSGSASESRPNSSSPRRSRSVRPAERHSCRSARASGVLKSSSSAARKTSQSGPPSSAAAVDLEAGSQKAFGHRGALDVPAGTANSPRRFPERVLAVLVALPEREVARILLERVLLLRFHLVGPLAGEPAVVGEAGDAV